MPVEVIPTTDLLSAYLMGDATPGECGAVERWLADDLSGRELLEELREMCSVLKAGDYVTTNQLVDALRKIIQTKIEDLRLKSLLTASVTGDLTTSEKSEVQAFLNAHPSAVSVQRQIAAAGLLLNSGQCASSAAQSDKLRQRLASALPAGALAPKKVAAPVAATVSPIQTPVEIVAPVAVPVSSQSARLQERPSLRVFVAPENPWKKRAWTIGGIAAAVAISVGARALINHHAETRTDLANQGTTVPTIQADPLKPEPVLINPVEKTQNSPIAKNEPVKPPVMPRDVTPHAIPVGPDALVKEFPAIPPKAPPEEPAVAPTIARGKEDAPNVIKSTDNATAKKDTPAAPDPTPLRNPSTNALPNGSSVARSAPNNTVTTPDPINGIPNIVTPGSSSTGVASGSGGGGLPILPPTIPGTIPTPVKTSPTLGPTTGGATILPQDGLGVTGVVKGAGTVQVNGPNGVVTTLKNTGDTVASGSTIITDDARVSLVLPGNGRLYIARFSNLKVTFTKNTLGIDLNGGEIYYIAPAGGSLTLNALKATASKVSEGDISLAAGKLTALDFSDFPMTLSAKKQNTISLVNGVQGSVAVDGNSAVKKDPAPTLNGLWRTDVLVPGDGIKAVKSHK